MSHETPYQECVRLVEGFFQGDRVKRRLWFETRNPLLGGVSPSQMIRMGRVEKLLKFIKTQLDGNADIDSELGV